MNIPLIRVSVMRDNSHKLMVHGNQICFPPSCLLTGLSFQSVCALAVHVTAPFDLFADALQVISLPSTVLLSLLVNQGERKQSPALITSLMRTLSRQSGLRLLRSSSLPPTTDQFKRSRGCTSPACPPQCP